MDTQLAPRTSQPLVEETRSGASWPTFAAWGAGLIQIALGAGAITGSTGTVAARAVGYLLLTAGVAALGWGLVALVRGRIVAPRTSVGTALAGLALGVCALAVDAERMSVFAVAVASTLLIAVALACAYDLRRQRAKNETPDAGASRVTQNTNVVGIIVGAVLIAGLVTPALAATEAGRLAPDHGDHGMIMEPGHH